MRIWKLKYNMDDFDWMLPMTEQYWDELLCDGTPKLANWTPVPVKAMEHGTFSDAPCLAPSTPVFSQKAVELLADLIHDSVEFLPLRSRQGAFYAVNVLRVLDCIDYERAQFKRLPNSHVIFRFEKYAFREECLQNALIFKIKDEPARGAFVSDPFRNRVINSDLTGFEFRLVWDSEKPQG